MGRKPLPDYKIEQIILMTANGEKTSTIAKAAGVSPGSVNSYQKRYWEAIEEKKEELSQGNNKSENEQKSGFKKPTPEMEKNSKNKNKNESENEDPIETASEDKFIKAGSTVASEQLVKMYKDLIKAGQSVMDSQNQYKSSVEEMGLKWDQFIRFSVKVGYQIVSEEYMNAYQKQRDMEVLALELEQELHNDEVKSIEHENGDDLDIESLLEQDEEVS